MGDGGEGLGGPLGAGLGKIAMAEERVPSGIDAVALFVVGFGGVDGTNDVDGKGATLAFAIRDAGGGLLPLGLGTKGKKREEPKS